MYLSTWVGYGYGCVAFFKWLQNGPFYCRTAIEWWKGIRVG